MNLRSFTIIGAILALCLTGPLALADGDHQAVLNAAKAHADRGDAKEKRQRGRTDQRLRNRINRNLQRILVLQEPKPKPVVVRYEAQVDAGQYGESIAWCPEDHIAIGGNVSVRLGKSLVEAKAASQLLSFGGMFPEGGLVKTGEGDENGRPYYHPFVGWGAKIQNISGVPLVLEAWAQCKFLPFDHDEVGPPEPE